MTKSKNQVEFVEALVCKEIEENENGTFSLMGVYPKDIALSKVPVNLNVSLWLNFNSKLFDDENLVIKISGKTMLENDLSVDVTLNPVKGSKKVECMPVVIKNMVLPIVSAGKFDISFKVDKGRWKKVRTVVVEAVQ